METKLAAHEAAPRGIQQTQENRILRHRLMKWRFLALAALILGLIIAVFTFSDTESASEGPYVARIDINGVITGDSSRSAYLRGLAEDEDIEAVIVQINSPGGESYGGEQLYKDLEFLRQSKPVVVVMETVAASAGYMIAMASDYILAGETTLTGSIGVLMQAPQITGLLEKKGIEAISIKSGDLKAIPDPLENLTVRGRAQLQETVQETFDWFLDLVVTQRNLPPAVIQTISDGRIVVGSQAVELGLIDAIGAETEALDWLIENKDISEDLEVYVVWPHAEDKDFIDRALDRALPDMGAKGQALMLDGLVSVWTPTL